MDAYSSLLNLNFMASLRTGNVVVDMLIAMMIPFVSGLIARFFRQWWPGLISWLVGLFQGKAVETVVAANREYASNRQVDLDENGFLQNVLLHYVANKIKPTYEYGSYQYKRLLSSGGATSKKRNPTFVDTLKSLYVMQTVPTKNREVELNSHVYLRIAENADEADQLESGGTSGARGGGGGDAGNGGNSGADNDKKDKLKAKTTTLIFRTHQSIFSRDDALTKFANEAMESFLLEQKKSQNKERYLYQPLMPAAGAETEAKDPPRCQRYPLSREKTFGTLFFPEKERLMRLIHQFETKTGKFAVPGFPRKLVLLFYGPPGTGKTSLVKAIAELTHRHIFSVPLSRVRTNRQLLDYMFDTAFRIKNAPKLKYRSNDYVEKLQPDRVVYVLEDVDAATDVVRRKGSGDSTADEAKTPSKPRKSKASAEDGADPLAEAEGAASAAKPALIKQDDDSSCSDDDDDKEEQEEQDEEDTEKGEAPVGGHEAEGEANGAEKAQEGASEKSKPQEETAKGKKKAPTVDRVAITADTSSPFSTDADRLSVKGIMEAFGGILDAPGRIVVMTTNHVDHLDPALLRPGIVTMKLHMGNFDAKCGVEMVRHYFANRYRTHADLNNSALSEEEREEEMQKPLWNEKLLAEVAKVIEEAKDSTGGFSPAEVEQLCAENETVEDLLIALRRGSSREVF